MNVFADRRTILQEKSFESLRKSLIPISNIFIKIDKYIENIKNFTDLESIYVAIEMIM